MLLSSKFLKNVDGLNSWSYKDNWTVRTNGAQGQNINLYFQIVDLDREGIRYIPGAGSTVQVTFPALGDEAFTATGSFEFSDDRSIVKISLTEDQVPYNGAVKFSLTEAGNTQTWSVFNALTVQDLNGGCC